MNSSHSQNAEGRKRVTRKQESCGASPVAQRKESACNEGVVGDAGSISGSGRAPGGGHGNPLQHTCQKNPRDRGAWWATVCSFAESDTTEVTWHTHIGIAYVKAQSCEIC